LENYDHYLGKFIYSFLNLHSLDTFLYFKN